MWSRACLFLSSVNLSLLFISCSFLAHFVRPQFIPFFNALWYFLASSMSCYFWIFNLFVAVLKFCSAVRVLFQRFWLEYESLFSWLWSVISSLNWPFSKVNFWHWLFAQKLLLEFRCEVFWENNRFELFWTPIHCYIFSQNLEFSVIWWSWTMQKVGPKYNAHNKR